MTKSGNLLVFIVSVGKVDEFGEAGGALMRKYYQEPAVPTTVRAICGRRVRIEEGD